MTATDELRRLLDERGVEYEAEDMQTNMQTYWGDWCFMEPLDAKPHTLGAQCELMLIPATPEQAIAATLGNTRAVVDITSLLNADKPPVTYVQERTCRIVEYDEAPFPVCSECGAVQPDDFTVYYCWNCGAKVVI